MIKLVIECDNCAKQEKLVDDYSEYAQRLRVDPLPKVPVGWIYFLERAASDVPAAEEYYFCSKKCAIDYLRSISVLVDLPDPGKAS